ncbi:hypothetical protein [Pantoea sp. NGS-ED-1003]|uniref:hypothetical protein n=1 Tax=Pantoea sp. NGS-ED-1003 TaxID=1526743 RepID=UPI00053485EF|nr:hypothetical protein [Pantoea sp. NGS-ED-1003]
MKLKMFTLDGSVIIDTNTVTQFSPDAEHGGNFTKVETLNDSGETSEFIVKHDFYQVTQALANAWSMEEKAVRHA